MSALTQNQVITIVLIAVILNVGLIGVLLVAGVFDSNSADTTLATTTRTFNQKNTG